MGWNEWLVRGACLAALIALAPIAVRAESSRQQPPAAAGGGDEIEGLRSRVAALESVVGRIRVGGWIDALIYDDNKGNGAKPKSKPFFDPQHLYVFLDSRINEHWQAFAEIEVEHSPKFEGTKGSGKFMLERSYIQYNHGDRLHGRVGKFNTPSGYWTPVHWAINVDTIQKPIHEDNQYVTPKSVGFELFGDWFPEIGDLDTNLGYAAFLSNGSEIFGTNEPQDGSLGAGGDLHLEVNDSYLLGLSYYWQRNPAPTAGTDGRRESTFTAYGNFAVVPSVTLRFEYQHQNRGDGDDNVSAWYAKVRWDFLDNAYLNYRFNQGDDDARGDGLRHTAHTATVGYRPVPAVRLKAEYNRNSFRSANREDFDSWGISLGYVF